MCKVNLQGTWYHWVVSIFATGAVYIDKRRDEARGNSSGLILNSISVYHILLCTGNAESNAAFISLGQ